ncbi:MAG: S41 family peptidase [Anaerohalosphaera sp.]|nr:S41 family peptidase [Anaerohalosphaera sp.]
MRSNKKLVSRTNLLFLLVIFALLGGFAGSYVQASGIFDAPAADKDIVGRGIADLALAEIVKGDFDSAGKLLAGNSRSGDDKTTVVSDIVSEYQAIEKRREEERQKAYEEEYAKLAEIMQKETIEDVNDIDDAFVAVIKTRNLDNDDQKKIIEGLDVTKNIIAKSLERARQFESQGEWVDSYAHCYYWLTALHEDNTEYKDHAEKLTGKAIIEASLEDNSCDTSSQRHANIKADMFRASLKILDIDYVSVVDYAEMARKGLKRCMLLGEVVMNTKKELAFDFSRDEIVDWNLNLKELESKISGVEVVLNRDKLNDIFDEVLVLNLATLKLPEEVVIKQFSEAALEALDPFTTLVWPWQVLDFQKSMTQNFSGIGVQISKIRGVLTVGSLLPDTPAFNSGLDANDQILEVNGEPTKDMTLQCAVSKITGPAGTEVTLTIKHEGAKEDETEEITIKRGRIVVATIRGWQRAEAGKWLHMVDPENGIGYVRLTAFTEKTATDLDRILSGLEAEGLKGLIIDLRFNSGGYLSTAAATVDLFVKKGLIVKSQPRWGIAGYEMASKKGTHPDYPLVVLVNEQSASASEIVAGALQDDKFKRATLVGTRSYGKGSVQTIRPNSAQGSQLKYTMAYYHLPSGQPVKNRYMMEKQGRDDWGVMADVEVKMRNDELRGMLDVQLANDVLTKANHDENAKPVTRHSLEEVVGSDPQLAVGLLVVKSKILESGGKIAVAKKQDKSKEDVNIETAQKVDSLEI